MRTVYPSARARLMATATGVLGLAAVSGCQPRTVAAPAQDVYAPQPVAAPQQSYNQATTFAIGEEEGGYAAPDEVFATTFAIGEEDGGGPIPVEPNGGIGDGAGPIPIQQNPPLPIGEVQGDYERIYIPPEPSTVGQPYNSGVATTLAIGEEG